MWSFDINVGHLRVSAIKDRKSATTLKEGSMAHRYLFPWANIDNSKGILSVIIKSKLSCASSNRSVFMRVYKVVHTLFS